MARIVKRPICVVICILVVLSVFATAICEAKSSELIDNAKILNGLQSDKIKSAMAKLESTKVVVVINDAGNRTTSDYAYQIAKELYGSMLSDVEGGVVIVYCTAKEGWKVGLYDNSTLNLNSSRYLDAIINSFSAYKTDSEWVEGSAISTIENIRRLEIASKTTPTPKPVTKSTDQPKQEEQTKEEEEDLNAWQRLSKALHAIWDFLKYNEVVVIFFALAVCLGVYGTVWYLKKYKGYKDDSDTPNDNK